MDRSHPMHGASGDVGSGHNPFSLPHIVDQPYLNQSLAGVDGAPFGAPSHDIMPVRRGRGRPRKYPVGEKPPKKAKKEKPPVPIVTPLIPPEGYVAPGNSSKSVHQKAALMRLFEQDQTPKKDAIRDVVMKTGLDYRECLKWFVGQRGAAKKKGKGNEEEGTTGGETAAGSSQKVEEKESPKPMEEAELSSTRPAARPRPDVTNLTKSQTKAAREWACQYSLVDDLAEKEYMIHQLVDQLNVKRRKELRNLLVKEPLRLEIPKNFKVRKSAADPSLTRDALIERADHCWSYLKQRFGAQEKEPGEENCLDENGNLLLDAAMVAGLEAMFSRHRDYFMALVYRFNIKDMFRRQIVKEARSEFEGKKKVGTKRTAKDSKSPSAAKKVKRQDSGSIGYV